MSFNAIRENKILTKISEFTVLEPPAYFDVFLFLNMCVLKTFCSGFIIETRKRLNFVRLYMCLSTLLLMTVIHKTLQVFSHIDYNAPPWSTDTHTELYYNAVEFEIRDVQRAKLFIV